MDFALSAQDHALRQAIRQFISERLPADIAARMKLGYRPARPEMQFWTEQLNSRGWAAPGWPVAHGGTGWSPLQRHLFEVEMSAAGAPPTCNMNFNLVGPVIYTFGSPDQQHRFLPPMLRGETFWCQGFSEPGAGSDLAALRTRAVRDGDSYVVNGQKIWTTDAQQSDWIFALVRTGAEGKPQAGISFLLIDLRSPGITIRPIRMLNGEVHLNEVFFDDVRVPAEQRVGDENAGWTYSKSLLTLERAASAEVPQLRSDLARLRRLLGAMDGGNLPAARAASLRERAARLEIDVDALEFSVLRVLLADGTAGANATASVLKIVGSELLQSISALMFEAIGEDAVLDYPVPHGGDDGADLPGPREAWGVTDLFLGRHATTIYGGANEVQRNLIAKSVLEL